MGLSTLRQSAAEARAAVSNRAGGLVMQWPGNPRLRGRPGPLPALTTAAIVAGLAFRLFQYVGNRSLWLDELLLAETLLASPLANLLDPRNLGPTPVGFAIMVRAATELFGTSEYALRLVPFIAGVIALLLAPRLASKFISPAAGLVTIWLFALSPFLIYYTSELKQYSTDVLTAVLVLLYVADLRAGEVTRGRTVGLCVVGVVGVVFSQPLVFIAAGGLLALALHRILQDDWPAVLRLTGVAGVWALVFGVPTVLLLRSGGPGEYMQSFWATGFMPLPPWGLRELRWFPNALHRIFEDPVGLVFSTESSFTPYLTAFALLGFVAGLGWACRRSPFTALAIVLPLLLCLFASGLRLYPFGGAWVTGGRVLLFLLPGILMLIAEGMVRMITAVRPALRWPVGAVLLGALLVPPLTEATREVPYGRAEIRPVIAYLATHYQPGDAVYVHYDALPAMRYYALRFGLDQSEYHAGRCARFAPHRYVQALDRLGGTPRVWVLLGSGIGAHASDEKSLLVSFLEFRGKQLDNFVSRGASLYLYDLRRPSRSRFVVELPAFEPSLVEGCALWGGD